jgi:D-amino-acid dehydrogenase
LDVSFIYDTKVLGVDTSKSNSAKHRITALRTNHGVIDVSEDMHVVVTAGAWTPHILALMDLYAPVYPLKGYAMSVSAKQALAENTELLPQDLPSRIVCDKYMYTTRLGDEIRITSIGEFSEWNTKPSPEVDENFRQEAMRQFPQLSSLISQATTYCGHRPYVSDGILLLGACSDTYDNLYVSCGPGSNGWKLAMGSGEVVARLVSGEKIEQMEEELGFDANAFSPQGRVLDAPTFAKICRARWNI